MKKTDLNIKRIKLYLELQQLADMTKSLIKEGKTQKARHCIGTIEDAFVNGSIEIRNAISNVYVFSVSAFLEMNRRDVNEFFPTVLQTEYYKQINTSGV